MKLLRVIGFTLIISVLTACGRQAPQAESEGTDEAFLASSSFAPQGEGASSQFSAIKELLAPLKSACANEIAQVKARRQSRSREKIQVSDSCKQAIQAIKGSFRKQ